MSSDDENQRLDPTMFLGATSPDGTPTAEPLFAAVHVTHELVDRLQLLADLCVTHGLQSVTTTELPEPVHWEIALLVHRHMALMGLWPPPGVHYEAGTVEDDDEA